MNAMRGKLLPSIVLLIIIFLIGESEQSSFEDERCICACPRSVLPNGTGPIFVKMIPASECLCERVVATNNSDHLCHFCNCRHETRNTTTIKVVAIFIICVLSLLLIYMAFLMCLDPLLHGRRSAPSSYTQQIDDDLTMDNMTAGQRPPRPASAAAATRESNQGGAAGEVMSRQSSLINRVTSEQQKWKGTVEEQRRNIYKFHNMLN